MTGEGIRHTLFDGSHGVMLLIDPESGAIVDANQKACSFYGYSRESLLGLNISDITIRPADEALAEMKRIRAGQRVCFNSRHRLADGEVRDVEVYSGPIDIQGRTLLCSIIHDETERRRGEELLRESESMYRTIFETTGTAMIIVEDDMTISLVNEQFEVLSGYSREGVEGRKKWTELRPGPDLGQMMEWHRLRREKPEAAPRHYETRFLDKKGRPVDIFLTVATIPGTRKSVASLLDITERKRTEQALRRANAYLENVFENSPDAIAILDREGKFIMWNKMAAELYGYTLEELRGKSAFDLWADLEKQRPLLDRLRREGSAKRWEIRTRRKDGSIVPVELSVGLLRDAGREIVGSVCLARDLSDLKKALGALRVANEGFEREIFERRRAEETAKRESSRLSAMISGMEEGVLFANGEGRIVQVNECFCRQVGIGQEALLGGGIEDVLPEDLRSLVIEVVESFKKDPASKAVVVQKTLNGIDTITRIQPVYMDSRYEGVLLNVIDVSDLVEARRKAEEADVAKSEFLANMSHEIRTPMNAILGLSHLALNADPTDRQRDYLTKIRSSAHNLLRIIDDILDSSKIEAGKIEIESVPLFPGRRVERSGRRGFPEGEGQGAGPPVSDRSRGAPRAHGRPPEVAAGPREPGRERRQIHGKGEHRGFDGTGLGG